MKGRLAWLIFAISVGASAYAAALPDKDWPLEAIIVMGTALSFASLCGALLASRRPRNAVGWILLAISFSISAGLLATQWADRAFAGELPGPLIAAWFQSWLWTPLTGLFPALVLLFPTGTLPSRRWRPVGWAVVAAAILPTISLAIRPGPFDTFPSVENPLGFGPSIDLFGWLAGAWTITVPAALVSVVIRFRRARDVERQQIKWFFFAAFAAVLLVVSNPIIFAINDNRDPFVFGVSLGLIFPVLAFLLLPVSITIAILRHRLYDIDRIVSRTVTYGLVTSILAAVFAALALGPTLMFGTGGGATPDYVIALGTLVVAALFRPLRSRVQRIVDRRFNRARYDATATLEAFTGRLRQQIDLGSLESELHAVVNETMQPNGVSLWLRS